MSWWTERQNKDPFIKLRDKNNYISRAYFKIEDIQKNFYIIKKDSFVLDLGASPGGWSQFISKFTENLYAMDLLDNFKVKKAKFYVGDVFDDNIFETLPYFNTICSDMAPNM
ncbi:MAG: SAM-dependent methyltransferase, partial [Bacteroidota bacterium]